MGSNYKNHILWGLLISLCVAGGLYYFLREEPLEEKRQESVITRMAFSGSTVTEELDGKRIWELTARVIEVDAKTQFVHMQDLTGNLYRADGSKIVLKAKTAVVDPKTRNIELADGLEMKAEDGASLQADKGRYAGRERKIFASGAIRASREDLVLTAEELETDDRFEMIVVKGKARLVKGGSPQ